MKIRDFFILITKLFGLYSLLIVLFGILPNSLQYIQFIEFPGEYYGVVLMIAFMLVLLLGFLVILIWYADKLVDFLKLENGFSGDEINLKVFDDKSIVKLASILFGAFFFVDALPTFINYTMGAFQVKATYGELDSNRNFYWIASIFQMLVGAYLVVSFKKVQQFLLKKED